MKHVELKNEYHHQIAHKKTRPKNINIVNIAGIPLEIRRSIVLKNADSAVFEDLRAPYLQRDTSYGNDAYMFLISLSSPFHWWYSFFNSKYYIFQQFFLLSQIFITKENNSLL